MIEMRRTLLDRDFWLAAAGTVAGVLIAMCVQRWLGFVSNWWDAPYCAFVGVYCGYTAKR